MPAEIVLDRQDEDILDALWDQLARETKDEPTRKELTRTQEALLRDWDCYP